MPELPKTVTVHINLDVDTEQMIRRIVRDEVAVWLEAFAGLIRAQQDQDDDMLPAPVDF